MQLVKLCREWGAKNFDEAMREAARRKHVKIVKLCKKWGANDFDGSMLAAAQGGCIEIVELCKVWGADNFDDIIEDVVDETEDEYIDIARLCEKWGGRVGCVLSGVGCCNIILLLRHMKRSVSRICRHLRADFYETNFL